MGSHQIYMLELHWLLQHHVPSFQETEVMPVTHDFFCSCAVSAVYQEYTQAIGGFLFLQERRRQREHRLEDLHGAMYTWPQHLKNLIQLQIYEFDFQFVGSEFTAQGPGFEMILFACSYILLLSLLRLILNGYALKTVWNSNVAL